MKQPVQHSDGSIVLHQLIRNESNHDHGVDLPREGNCGPISASKSSVPQTRPVPGAWSKSGKTSVPIIMLSSCPLLV